MALDLAWETPVAWVGRVATDPLALLSDHAHCELKAAASGQALIGKNPGHASLVRELPEVVIEEMQHFERVLDLLRARGGRLGEQEPSPYADGLYRGAARTRRSLFLDRLVVAHLIEARSLERFRLLAEHLPDPELRALYAELLPSEGRHRGLFLRLAREAFPDTADARVGELRALEGDLLAGLPFAHRVHSGMGDAPLGGNPTH